MKISTLLLFGAVAALGFVLVGRELDSAKRDAFGGLGFLKDLDLSSLRNLFAGDDSPTFDEWTLGEYGTKFGDPDDWKILE